MLIGIDGNEANIANRVGSNIYAFELLRQFSRLKKNNLKFRIYLKEKPLPDLPEETVSWQYRVVGPKRLWTHFALPINLYLKKDKPEIFFTPGHYGPRFSPIPSIIAILDVSYLKFPEQFLEKDLFKLKVFTKQSLHKAVKVLTISQASKNDIINYYKVKPEKISVFYPGINQKNKVDANKTQEKIQYLREKYKIKGEYLIYVGTLQPRKNLERLIKALSLVKDHKNELKLVICGKKGWLYERIFQKVKELSLEDRVIFTGFVDDQDLPYLVKGSLCLILVSLYEGFGFPVVEAMSLGVPVIASKSSSLGEIAGKAGILVDPVKIVEITKAIEKLIDFYRHKPHEYQKLIEKGLAQAKKFSWEKCSRQVLVALQEVAVNVP